jgi:beta-barrel assembly-enhancing protease
MFNWLFVRQNLNAVRGRAKNLSARTVHRGTIEVTDEAVLFESMDAEVSLPLSGLKMYRNRWIGGSLRFSHKSEPDWILLTRDERVLQAPAFDQQEPLVRRKAGMKLHFYHLRWAFKAASLALLLAILFIAPFRIALAQRAIGYIPIRHEVTLGDNVMKDIRKTKKFFQDPTLTLTLDRISHRMIENISDQDRRFAFRFHIVADKSVNAYALPGGNIVLHSGLILEAESADEIAGVLGHEMGHVTRRHSMSHLVQTVGSLTLMKFVLGADVDVPEVARALAFSSFNRDQEREADAKGIEYLRIAEVDPRGLMGFFERMANRKSSLPKELVDAVQLLSTHPLPEERLQNLAALASENQVCRPLDVDFPSFKNRVRILQDTLLPPLPAQMD